ncbi:endo-1,4-beta-xylanase [Litchfieldia salsa]|uniref:Beta-xylanase n=1 Tax=Litchfieldia salsa TaxID=930152 RepID=A0A1H0PB91_9BACI|nr:endo-1,4-beta-xylanase [Litchfieldia salsa]SDP02283.1 endo-1,4-beta-xylanase [Litchfieldia salsa]
MKQTQIQKDVPSFYKALQEFFPIGAAVNPSTLVSGNDLLVKQFKSLTSENHMKFENIQPQEGVYTFENADQIIDFAAANDKLVRGHTLVWHNQTPDWVFKNDCGEQASREQVLERMSKHISTVVGRYKGKIHAWDVVNEAVTDSGPDLLRDSKWLQTIGEDYISKAFHFAHMADPDATLFYNDYNESNPEKREKIYTLVKGLVEQGVPIHGIGLQAHWNLYNPSLDDIRCAIERYASLGLQLHITEMDVSMFNFEDQRIDLTEPTEEMVALHQQRYEQFFSIFKEYKEVISNVTFWGIADDYTWLDDFPVVGRKNWPFLFDTKHQPKSSFWSIVNK